MNLFKTIEFPLVFGRAGARLVVLRTSLPHAVALRRTMVRLRSSPHCAQARAVGASATIALARFAPYTQKTSAKISKAFAAIKLVFKGFYTWF
jgi:hypothetical protein